MRTIQSGRRYGVKNSTLLLLSLLCLGLGLIWPYLPIERDPVEQWAGLVMGSIGLVVWASRALRRGDGEAFQIDDDGLRIVTRRWEATVPWASIRSVEPRKQNGVSHLAVHVADGPIGTVRPIQGSRENAERGWSRYCSMNRTVFGTPIVLVAWRHGLSEDALRAELQTRIEATSGR
ncbi:MAG: hypothetical protein AAF211_33785 [Myxococcota bacterium]